MIWLPYPLPLSNSLVSTMVWMWTSYWVPTLGQLVKVCTVDLQQYFKEKTSKLMTIEFRTSGNICINSYVKCFLSLSDAWHVYSSVCPDVSSVVGSGNMNQQVDLYCFEKHFLTNIGKLMKIFVASSIRRGTYIWWKTVSSCHTEAWSRKL